MASLTSIARAPVADTPLRNLWRRTTAVFDRMEHDEKVFLSTQIVLIELFLLVTLLFGYAGLIVFAKAAAAITLTTIVAITSTGLRRPRNAAARRASPETTGRPRPHSQARAKLPNGLPSD